MDIEKLLPSKVPLVSNGRCLFEDTQYFQGVFPPMSCISACWMMSNFHALKAVCISSHHKSLFRFRSTSWRGLRAYQLLMTTSKMYLSHSPRWGLFVFSIAASRAFSFSALYNLESHFLMHCWPGKYAVCLSAGFWAGKSRLSSQTRLV